MADLFLLLLFAAGLLLAAPQVVSYVIGELLARRGWWGMLLAVAAAPLVFYLIATRFYAPEAGGALVESALESGALRVHDPRTGAAVHAAVAAVVQVFRYVRRG